MMVLKNIKYFLFYCLTSTVSFTYCQTVLWGGQYNCQLATINDLHVDQNENIFYAGDFRNYCDFDPTTGIDTFISNQYHGYLAKLDSSGAYQWARRFESNVEIKVMSIVTGQSGDIIVSGHFRDSADFDPGPGTYVLHAIGNFYNIFVCKLDINGDFKWAKVFSPLPFQSASQYNFSLESDINDNIYFSGYVSGDVDFDPDTSTYISSGSGKDAFVCKLNKDGEFIWVNRWGGQLEDKVYDLVFDNNGFMYVVGDVENDTIDFDPGISFNNLICNATTGFVSKFDTSGNYYWTRILESTFESSCYRIKFDGISSLYIAGNATDSTDFDPGTSVYYLQYNHKSMLYLLKLDINGSLSWAKPFFVNTPTSCYVTGLYLNPAGSIYLTASYLDSIDVDPGPNLNLLYGGTATTNLLRSALVISISDAGNFINAFDFPASGDANGPLISGGPSGFILSSLFYGIIDFDPGTGSYNMDFMNGIHYIVKYGHLPLMVDNNISLESAINIFPNPVGEKGNIYCTLDRSGHLELTLSDQLGNCVKKLFNGKIQSGQNEFILNVSLPNGIYILRGVISNHTFNKKIVIVN
jgi:hypothetical protein